MPKSKSKTERLVEKKYNEYLDAIQQKMGNQITYTNDLEKYGKYALGGRFQGVFSSDSLKKLSVLKPYAIVNLDKSNQPGSHWIAIAYNNDEDDTITIYDSFGRNSKKIIPNIYSIYNGIIDTDNDKEQRISEDNCGQRSLAWLMVYDKLGRDAARLI